MSPCRQDVSAGWSSVWPNKYSTSVVLACRDFPRPDHPNVWRYPGMLAERLFEINMYAADSTLPRSAVFDTEVSTVRLDRTAQTRRVTAEANPSLKGRRGFVSDDNETHFIAPTINKARIAHCRGWIGLDARRTKWQTPRRRPIIRPPIRSGISSRWGRYIPPCWLGVRCAGRGSRPQEGRESFRHGMGRRWPNRWNHATC